MHTLPETKRTVEFLRKAAIELRAIAAEAPDIADQLRRIADELEAEAVTPPL